MNIVPRYVPIDGFGNEKLVRDTRSMGVININTSAYTAAQERAKAATSKLASDAQDKATLLVLQQDMKTMRSDVQEIKDSLNMLINKLQLTPSCL
jgi:vacuolar-type H+-ATPase subunit F/Vma7